MSATHDEKKYFDKLSSERQKHGYIPDLDRMQDNDFFYLSPLRRRALANLQQNRTRNFVLAKLLNHIPHGSRVLDLGCGSGWFSLELAKAGFHVTAVDLSEASIDLARETLRGANLAAGGSVTYHCADLNAWQVDRDDYEAVCYIGSLHHLANPEELLGRVKARLKPKHYLIASEPLPGNYGDVESAIGLLIRGILSACNAWYEKVPLPRNRDEMRQSLDEIRFEYANWADKHQVVQSPMNNSSDGEDNMQIIEQHYRVLDKDDILALQQRLIGGIRVGSDEENLQVARFITEIETLLLANGAMKSGGFNVFGVAL